MSREQAGGQGASVQTMTKVGRTAGSHNESPATARSAEGAEPAAICTCAEKCGPPPPPFPSVQHVPTPLPTRLPPPENRHPFPPIFRKTHGGRRVHTPFLKSTGHGVIFLGPCLVGQGSLSASIICASPSNPHQPADGT